MDLADLEPGLGGAGAKPGLAVGVRLEKGYSATVQAVKRFIL